MNIRIIPRLDIKGPNLVKGVRLEGLRVLGKPERFAKFYYENGADELCYMDAVASLYGRNSLFEIIERTAKEIFIPLTVGGGIRSIDDIRKALRSGADKVAINTSAIKNPKFISEAAEIFGSSTIVVSIEAMKTGSEYTAYTDYGREPSGLEVVKWAKQAAELGAGEISLTSVEREGTGAGLDLNLIKMVTEAVSIPVIAHGGAGKLSHITDVIEKGRTDAISLASLLHYNAIGKMKFRKDEFDSEGNTAFLNKDESFLDFEKVSLAKIKQSLSDDGFMCRRVLLNEEKLNAA